MLCVVDIFGDKTGNVLFRSSSVSRREIIRMNFTLNNSRLRTQHTDIAHYAHVTHPIEQSNKQMSREASFIPTNSLSNAT